MILNDTALVLEGGGMRGTFTAGVLDYMIENKIRFPYTIGVSAGASTGVSYISRQKGRTLFSNTELQHIRPYIGMKHFIRGKGFIDLDFLFYEYPQTYYPFDFAAYRANPDRFVMVTSNCLTGLPEYFEEKESEDRLVHILRASCSLPVFCPISYIDEVPMVDGGVCDSIPYARAQKDGYSKQIVVLTRNLGYRKPQKDFHLPSFLFKKYPHIRQRLKKRYIEYNEQ